MASQSSKSSPKKPKLVRDSFTIPKSEFLAIDALKTRAIALGTSVKKSELLRAGLMALQGLSDTAYKAALTAVPTLKTGRPTGAEKPAAASPAKAATKVSPKPSAKAATKAPTKAPAKEPGNTPAKATGKTTAARKSAAKVPARKTAAKKRVVTKSAVPARKTA
jgi:hypothetical protein